MLSSQLVEKATNVYSHESSFLTENQAENNYRFTKELSKTYGGVLYVKEFAEDEEIIQQDCSRKDQTLVFVTWFILIKTNIGSATKKFFDYRNETRLNESLQIISEDSRMRILIVYGYQGSFVHITSKIPNFIGFEHQKAHIF